MKNKIHFRRTILSLGVLFLIFNIMAYMHAYRFTHVIDQGVRTKNAEALSLWGKIRILFTGVTVIKRPNITTPEDIGYVFMSKTIHGEELNTPVWEIQHETPKRMVILFHGYNGNKSSLLFLTDWLVQQQSNVILVDFPGCGDSPYNWTSIGYRESEIVYDVYHHYQSQTDQPIILYGISLGASSIVAAFHQYSLNPDGLILEMPFGSLLQTVGQRFKLMGFPVTFPFAEMLVFWGSVQMKYNAFAFNPIKYAGDVSVPTLLFGGEVDFRVPATTLNKMYDQLQGPKKIHIFKGAGHYSLFVERPDEYRHIVLEFFINLEEIDY
ncbi:alpha/beta hydrolase [bacterium]